MPNTSKNDSEMPTENTANERNDSSLSPNQPSNESSKAVNPNNDDSNLALNTDNTSSHAKVAADLPVLAKDSYFLGRLERELARAAVANNKRDKKDSDNKAEDGLAKKRAQYDKIKTRSQQAVQARMDSIPDKLAEKLNLDLPVSQRADDLIQAIIDNQVIIVAGETGSGKTTQLPK